MLDFIVEKSSFLNGAVFEIGGNLFDLMRRGGVLMIPIGLCSVLAVAIILERIYQFHRARSRSEELLPRLKDLIAVHKFEEALKLCQKTPGVIARVLEEVIRNQHLPAEELEKLVSRVGSRYLRDLSKYLRGLDVIGNLTPLMGLLGTVFGMIKAFMKVAELSGKVNPSVLASGIWEALITTAAGLMVAIPVLMAYHYLENRVDDYAFQMQNASMELLQVLKERTL